MGKYTGPKCRLCRREGIKLFLRGERCFSAKCALVKRKYPPGIHGPGKGVKARITEYGRQLRAKQSAKRIYGLYEKQFFNYYQEATRKKGDTGSLLLILLEKRLDNVILRSGLVESRTKARQIVSHGYFLVNGKSVDIPSFSVSVGDIITIKEIKKKKTVIKDALATFSKRSKNIPSWMQVDVEKGEIKALSEPQRDDVMEHIDEKLIVEFYSKK